jgi:hypothetical protein
MRENKYIFFAIIIFIVIGASFFASTKPDGLEFIAGKLGFLEKGIRHQAILTGNTPLSTAVAGIAGIFLCSGLIGIYSFFLTSKNKSINK